MSKPKCRFNEHHRVPQSMGGTNHPSNISRVRESHHSAYHQLFNTGTPDDVAKYLNEVWIDPKKILVVEDRPPGTDPNQIKIPFP